MRRPRGGSYLDWSREGIMKTRVLVFVIGSVALFGCATRQLPQEPRLAQYRTAAVSADSWAGAITVNPEQVFGN
jgi:hypothetical protein